MLEHWFEATCPEFNLKIIFGCYSLFYLKKKKKRLRKKKKKEKDKNKISVKNNFSELLEKIGWETDIKWKNSSVNGIYLYKRYLQKWHTHTHTHTQTHIHTHTHTYIYIHIGPLF